MYYSFDRKNENCVVISCVKVPHGFQLTTELSEFSEISNQVQRCCPHRL